MMKLTATPPALALSLVALLSISSPGSIASAAGDAATKATTEAQLETINSDIEHLKGLLSKLNRERSSTEQKLQRSEQEMSKLRQSIRSLENQLEEGNQQVKKLQRRQQELTARKNKEKKHIASSVHSAYLASRDNRLKLLLNQESPEDISRHLTYLKHLQQAQLDAITAFENTLREIDNNTREQEQVNASLSQQKSSLQEQRDDLKRVQGQRQRLISQIRQRQGSSNQRLKNLDRQRHQLETILSQLAAKAALQRPITSDQGDLKWPVEGEILYGYRQKRPQSGMSWEGVLIAVDSGTRVNAVHDGTVIFSNWLRGFGQLIILDHGDDYLTLYAHNQWLLKAEGETVLAGEPLALAGQSGGLEQPGLYFEIRHKGKPQNPSRWLQTR
ncbi:murein hydrolase activator EnvC family protein [Endozoicomonas euniceicola]|uniref:Peptidoglycan DD-metalloendopeptidase family protein n=1 Tax=Endozoicomonas euniceicola TaxID=1234143 RepID=A0ABY6H3T2_9GAMM|nr:peptidoglycan DD-metalloendopeptidase family protein [Endozoicomonas euniceicola]UYM18799.1 peptidoglycan DD-metalloendopeptidase family protein [Endozoicomonas euniceicola]